MRLRFVHLTVFLQFFKVSVGEILAKDEDIQANNDLSKCRDKESNTPCNVCRLSVLDTTENIREQQVGKTSTGITPAGSNSVRRAHNSRREHGGTPELASDKGSQGETNAQTHSNETSRGGDGSHAERSGRCQKLKHAVAITRAKGIADNTKEDTGEDSSSHRGDGTSRDILLSKIEIVSNDGKQRCSSCKEGNEERHPTELESQVVRFAKAPELEHFGPAGGGGRGGAGVSDC